MQGRRAVRSGSRSSSMGSEPGHLAAIPGYERPAAGGRNPRPLGVRAVSQPAIPEQGSQLRPQRVAAAPATPCAALAREAAGVPTL